MKYKMLIPFLLIFTGCNLSKQQTGAKAAPIAQTLLNKVKPAIVEKYLNGDFPRIALTVEAAQRLGIVAVSIVARDQVDSSSRQVSVRVPRSALIYDSQGVAGIYKAFPQQTYQRIVFKVFKHEGDYVVGEIQRASGDLVVSVGAAELFGIEGGIGQ